MKRYRRTLLILSLVALCIGVLGAGGHYWSRGVPMQLQVLFQSVAALSEKSEVHDEHIQLIVADFGELKASLCAFYGTGPRPDVCAPDGTPISECVVGICDTTGEGDPCEGPNPPSSCGNPDPGGPGT
jgi:hypothetical protein